MASTHSISLLSYVPIMQSTININDNKLISVYDFPKYFKENYSRMPIIRVHIEQDALTLQALSNKKIFAFAGIGYPDKFFNMLTEYGCNIVAAKAFPDHHPYTDTEMLDLISAASDMDAVLLTTAKDMVRIPSRYCSHVRMIKAYTVWDSVDLLCQILASFLKTDEKDKPVEKN